VVAGVRLDLLAKLHVQIDVIGSGVSASVLLSESF
jgi:hypothetical protein